MMARIIDPKETTRAMAYELWMKAPNPMVTFFKTLDVTNLIRVSRRRGLKFNMLLDWCIGKAAAGVKEFYILPVGDQLIAYDSIAVNTIVKTAPARSAPATFCLRRIWTPSTGSTWSIPPGWRKPVLTETCRKTAWSSAPRPSSTPRSTEPWA